MKGLIVKSTTWNGETCKIGMPDGGVGIAVNAMERDKYCFWASEVTTLKKNGIGFGKAVNCMWETK